ncbi:integrase [Novosphingobium sp. ZW T3_23]|uniref:integrase n=1 Tax=Novosphingobium sp. ZW T3_23 TaxID=3378084 RepID=UPI003854BE61
MTSTPSSTVENEDGRIVVVHGPGEQVLPRRGSGHGVDRVSRLLAAIEGLLPPGPAIDAAVMHAAMERHAPASIKAMTNDLDDYARYCRKRRLIGLPADEAGLLPYLADGEARGLKPTTLARRLATLRALHTLFGWGDIDKDRIGEGDVLRDFLRDARARAAARKVTIAPVAAISLQALLDACEDDPPGLRDAALLSLASETGHRMARIASVTCADLAVRADGSAPLPLSSATMRRIEDWIAVSGIEDGALFRRVAVRRVKARAGAEPSLRKLAWNHRRGEGRLGARAARPARVDYAIGETALTAAAIRLILERRARRAAELGLIALQGPALEAVIAALDIRSLR